MTGGDGLVRKLSITRTRRGLSGTVRHHPSPVTSGASGRSRRGGLFAVADGDSRLPTTPGIPSPLLDCGVRPRDDAPRPATLTATRPPSTCRNRRCASRLERARSRASIARSARLASGSFGTSKPARARERGPRGPGIVGTSRSIPPFPGGASAVAVLVAIGIHLVALATTAGARADWNESAAAAPWNAMTGRGNCNAGILDCGTGAGGNRVRTRDNGRGVISWWRNTRLASRACAAARRSPRGTAAERGGTAASRAAGASSTRSAACGVDSRASTPSSHAASSSIARTAACSAVSAASTARRGPATPPRSRVKSRSSAHGSPSCVAARPQFPAPRRAVPAPAPELHIVPGRTEVSDE